MISGFETWDDILGLTIGFSWLVTHQGPNRVRHSLTKKKNEIKTKFC